jgi:DNA-binding MarR family transcriptional regulator
VSAAGYRSAPVACPNCKTRFAAPVLTIVDAAQNPEGKALLLSGQLNVAVCPSCGHGGVLSTPLVYHDAEKELLLTHVPPELGMAELEQQRVIGELTNRVMSSLPPEKRKGYLLQPRSFMRLDALIETILEAEGVTREMLEAQRAKANLLQRLLRTPGEAARRVIAHENDAQIDYEFLQLLTLNLQLAQAQGDEGAAQQLATLRQQLLSWTSAGKEVAARQEAIRELGPQVTREMLLEKLVAASLAGDETRIETMVAVARPLIDYAFYQQLSEHIETTEAAGQAEEARRLKDLRQTILDLTAEIDAEMEQLAQESNELLERILNSDDVDKAVRESLPQLDQFFMELLAENMRAAERAGNRRRMEGLQRVADTFMRLIEESQPQEIRFINELLTADYPAGTEALLRERQSMVSDELLGLMELVEQDLADENRAELAGRLAQIRQQAAGFLS